MDEIKDWKWLVKTNKGDFFMTIVGKWTQEEAATRLRGVFHVILKLPIIGMIPRKRVGRITDERTGTILEKEDDPVGFEFFAGKKLWEVSGREAEYEAQLILSRKQ